MFELFYRGVIVYNTADEGGFITENYPKAENISIDYAILEHETLYLYASCFIRLERFGYLGSII